MQEEQEQALRLATEVGHILLENGAEIDRVEESMERIATAYEVEDESFFVLSNGIIATGQHYARAEFIPIRGMQLSRVVDVNQLSRDVATGKLTLDEARSRLETIRTAEGKPWWESVLGAAFGVSSFSILFGGSLTDAAGALLCGLLLGIYVTFIMPHIGRIFGNLIGGLLGGLLCILSIFVGLGDHLANMIIGTIILLVPGVPFTNGMRDLANEDYIAGATRLLDAFLAFLCIALGVALSFIAEGYIRGSIIQLGAPVKDSFAAQWPIQLSAALLGTISFSALFGAPRRYYLACGLTGMLGWLCYLAVPLSATGATFCGSLVAATVSSVLAIARKCPSIVFLIGGIIPLVPGGGIFWTAYYLVNDQLLLAATTGYAAIKITIAIAGGIIIASAATRCILRAYRKHLAKKE